LIVEDSEETIRFLSQILQDHGYPYQVARNGVEAIAAVRQNRPDLVLLDIMMPRKSGVQVFREMKSDPDLANIPIIVVTGISGVTGVDLQTGQEEPKEDEGDVVARQLGFVLGEKLKGLTPDGLIEKPITPSVLVNRIKELLS
jgi:CheY-like chemotaxis protein